MGGRAGTPGEMVPLSTETFPWKGKRGNLYGREDKIDAWIVTVPKCGILVYCHSLHRWRGLEDEAAGRTKGYFRGE